MKQNLLSDTCRCLFISETVYKQNRFYCRYSITENLPMNIEVFCGLKTNKNE